MPHGHCYFWQPEILWTHIVGDILTSVSYYFIPVALIIFIKKRKDIEFRQVFILFGLFILLCGATHTIDIWTIWVPTYRLESFAKLMTGLVSVSTSIVVFRLIPKALKIPNPVELKEAENLAGQAAKAIEQIEDYAIQLLDLEGNIQNWNEGVQNLKGYKPEDILGKNFSTFFSEEQRQNRLPVQLIHTADRAGKAQYEGWLRKKDNSYFWGNLTITAVRNEEGVIIGYVKITRDFTQRRKNEKRERRLLQIEARKKEVEQFSYIASHDMQAPLQTVKNFADLMREDYHDKLDDDGHKYLDFISESITRMENLIEALLNYSRIGKNEKLELVHCNELLEAVLADLSFKIQKSETSFEIGELPVLAAYKTEMRMLFQNLISNAIKFRREDISTHVRISAHKERDLWKFAIQDNGIGISKKHTEKIFQVFQRLHSKDEYEGTGIGLANCVRIVELHGGKIWVESTEGEGSTFYFTIPILNSPEFEMDQQNRS